MTTAMIFIKKYLPYLIIVIAIISFIAWAISSIYKAGEESKNAEWLVKDARQRDALAKAMGEAMQRVADQRKKDAIHTMEVVNEKNDQINRLNSDIADGKRMRIHTQSPACNGNSMPGKDISSSDTGRASDGTGIRISAEHDEEIYVSEEIINDIINGLHKDRELLKIHLKACIKELKPLVEVAKW